MRSSAQAQDAQLRAIGPRWWDSATRSCATSFTRVSAAFKAKVDVYTRYDRKPGPTMVYIHGGGWTNGSKGAVLRCGSCPICNWECALVSVQYRLAGVAPAPAAVKDCRCALYWVFQNARKVRL